MIFRPLKPTVGRTGITVTAKGRRVKPPRSVIFRKIMEEKRRHRTTSTGSLDGTMITRDNCLVRPLEVTDSVANSLRAIPELDTEDTAALALQNQVRLLFVALVTMKIFEHVVTFTS